MRAQDKMSIVQLSCICLWIVEELFSARVPQSSAEVRRVLIHDIKEVEDVRQQETAK